MAANDTLARRSAAHSAEVVWLRRPGQRAGANRSIREIRYHSCTSFLLRINSASTSPPNSF